MGILGRIKSFFSTKANPHYLEYDRYGEQGVSYELLTNPEVVLQLPYVYACLNVIGTAIAGARFHINRDEDSRDPFNAIKGHPLAEKLKAPNESMTGGQLFEGTEWWRLIHGNAYWLLDELDSRGRPKNIYLLDPRRVKVAVDGKRGVIGYIFDAYDGNPIRLQPDEVIHFKQFNPFHPIYGLGTLQAGALHFDTALSREKYENGFFKRGAKPGAVLKVPETLSKAEFERIKREWRKMYENEKNSHRTAILEGGFDFQPISFDFQQMDKVAGDKFSRDKTLAMFNVPPSAVQAYDNVNRASAYEAEYTFMKRTISPKLIYYEDMINKILTPRYRRGGFFRFENVVPQDEEALNYRIEVLSMSGAATVNDIRRLASLPPLPDEIGNQLILPPGSPLNPNNNEDQEPEQEQTQEGSEPNPEQEKRMKVMPTYRLRGKRYSADDLNKEQEKWIEKFVKEHRDLLETFFREQFERISAQIYGRGKSAKAYNFEPNDVWDDEAERGYLSEVLLYLYLLSGRTGFDRINELLGGNLEWYTRDPSFQEAMKKLEEMIDGINSTTRKKVLEIIREGMRRGYSIRQIINGYPKEDYPGLKGLFNDFIENRVETILIDGAVAPYNIFSLHAAKKLGVKHVFVTDGRQYDEPCRMADGSIWTVDRALRNYQEHPRCKRKFWPIPLLRGDANGDQEG